MSTNEAQTPDEPIRCVHCNKVIAPYKKGVVYGDWFHPSTNSVFCSRATPSSGTKW